MSAYYTSRGNSEYGGYGGSSHYGGGGNDRDPGVVEEVIASRGRRVLRGAVVCDDELSCYYEGMEGLNDPYKSTVCMDHHVLSRMQDDLRRADIRRSNPKSAIPPRCEELEEEIESFLNAADALPESRRRGSTASRGQSARGTSARRRSVDNNSLPPIGGGSQAGGYSRTPQNVSPSRSYREEYPSQQSAGGYRVSPAPPQSDYGYQQPNNGYSNGSCCASRQYR